MWQAARHALEYHRANWSRLAPQISWHAAPDAADADAGTAGERDGSSRGTAGSGVAPHSGTAQVVAAEQLRAEQRPGGHRQWRVLFLARSQGVRQLLNLDELLAACAGWLYLDAATSTLHTARCGVWPAAPGVPAAMAGAQAAHWQGTGM